MQRPHLTAKVFRYLRTLIGKAAIDWGFLQNLILNKLRKFVNQPTSGRNHTQYFDLSSYAKCFVLIKQSYNTILCLLLRHTLSRSYGVNLPSSLMIVISNAFVFSTCSLVVVSRYGLSLWGILIHLYTVSFLTVKNLFQNTIFFYHVVKFF